MAESVKTTRTARRTTKTAAENSTTGKTVAARPVRKSPPTTQPVAEPAAEPVAKKRSTAKAPRAVKKVSTPQDAPKPVLVKGAEVVRMPVAKAAATTHEQIAQLAYRYWQERGCQHGHHHEDWVRAEQELRAVTRHPLGKAS